MSINIPAVKLAQQTGTKNVINLAQKLGISSLVPEDDNLSTALGGLTQGVNLYELTSAYTAFANSGILSQPISIIKVVGENGQVLEEAHLLQQSVLDSEIAYLMTDMLKDVIVSGTGTGANIGRIAAGKTGTTDNYETAWFIGYTPELLTGIFIGNDDRTSVGISGSEVAVLWGGMMAKVLSGTPVTSFTVPPNIITNIAVCADSGKLATPLCREIEYSAFIRGTEPTKIAEPPLEKPVQPSDKKNAGFPWKLFIPRLPGF
jgi:penicillin-binding protein 1A